MLSFFYHNINNVPCVYLFAMVLLLFGVFSVVVAVVVVDLIGGRGFNIMFAH